MLLSLVPVVPWMIIGKFFDWRHYKIILSNFIPPNGMGYAHFTHLPLEITWPVFILFVLSIFFILRFEKNNLPLFFLLLYCAYYLFLAVDLVNVSPRMSMAFYPSVSVLTSLFISFIADRIRWKHSFKFTSIALILYLILNCTVPSLNAPYLSHSEFKKFQDYPAETAMKWVRDNVKNGEKILTLRIMPALFYADKYGIDRSKIIHFEYDLSDIDTPEKLRKFVNENKITYIMFPYGPKLLMSEGNLQLVQYLRENTHDEFTEAAKYELGENYIFIYRLIRDAKL